MEPLAALPPYLLLAPLLAPLLATRYPLLATRYSLPTRYEFYEISVDAYNSINLLYNYHGMGTGGAFRRSRTGDGTLGGGRVRVRHVIKLAQMRTSSDKEDVIVTHAMGSSLALVIFDSRKQVGGLVHCMLPESDANADLAKTNPCMFTDTGAAALLGALKEAGADPSDLRAHLIGAAQFIEGPECLEIGARNVAAAKTFLEKKKIPVAGEAVGGNLARTVALYVDGGRVTAMLNGKEEAL